MSRENVEIVRRLYEAVNRRDTETVLSLYAPDFEWDGSRTRWSEVLSGESTFRGHAGLRTFFRHYLEVWDSFQDELDELIDTGDQVVSVVTSRGRGRASGVDIEWTGNTGVWTIRDGMIVRVVWFPSRQDALEAVGLRE